MLIPAALAGIPAGRLTLVGIASFVAVALARGQEAVQLAPRPAWVDPLPIEDRVAKGALRGAVDHLLLDFQDDARGDTVESYVHAAKRVLNEQGVQHQSEISIDFDPTCQTLTVHTVALLRDGERTDALAHQAFQVIQRESQLDRQVYDGTRTALLFVEGVRIGDVLELEYTLRGRSPLFEGRYFSSFATQLSVPVHRMRKRILWHEGRTLHTRAHGRELEPDIRDVDGGRELVWDLRDLEPLNVESDVPSWFEAYPWIQFSEYEHWNEVAGWGAKLFARQAPGNAKIRAAADTLRTESHDATEELRRALRFVQGEVRYLSIALGEGSHRPSQPEEVLSRRYGDCKDKALLLVALLTELGIDARPALVNTSALHSIESWIATPAAFDHVIVRATVDGDEWWVDPTMTHERGPLSEQSLLEYGRALVLDSETTELAVVKRDQGTPALTTIRKTFEVRLDAASRFVVETVYEGADANAVRSGLGWQTTEDLTDRCRDFYLADYPSLTVDAPAEVVDQEAANRVVIRERYAIPDLWGRSTKEGWARFSAREISEELSAPETTHRATPADLTHPRHVKCHSTVLLPDHWEVEPETVSVRNGSMQFEHRVSYANRQLELSDEYRTLRDHVPAAECAAFAADIENARNNLRYEISDPTAPPEAAKNDQLYALIGAALVVGVLVLGALVVVIVLISARRRPSAPHSHTNSWGSAPRLAAVGDGVPAGFDHPRREGSVLVLPLEAELPPRCIYCNREESIRVRREFTWHTPWLYFLILAGFLFYAIIAMTVNKRARLAIPLCRAHQRRRIAIRVTVAVLAVGGFVCTIAGAGEPGSGSLAALGMSSIVASLFLGFGSRLRPARIDERFIRLRGAGAEFLDSLSEEVEELKRAA